jgi:hypothetical protein
VANADDEPDWETCKTDGCIAASYRDDLCVGHSPEEVQRSALAELTAGAPCGWTRGLEIDVPLMKRIRDAARSKVVDGEERRVFPEIDFTRAKFMSQADFQSATFTGRTSFEFVEFRKGAEFGAARFEENCNFRGAIFSGRAFFKMATFCGAAYFLNIECKGAGAGFNMRSVRQGEFSGSRFRTRTVISGEYDTASFDGCVFETATDFSIAVGLGDARGTHSNHGCVSLRDTTFGAVGDLGTIHAMTVIDLHGSRFDEAFGVELVAPYIRLSRVRTVAGAHIEFSGDLDLSDANASGPTLITPLPDNADHPQLARILSVRRAMVADLTLSGVDLRPCHFAGAHRLDELHVERTVFPRSPRTWSFHRPIRWTARQTIAEEHLWRRTHHGDNSGWEDLGGLIRSQGSGAGDADNALHATQIVGIYRALRKGREDARDEPGGADFYYGEMEMRRLGRTLIDEPSTGTGSRPERAVLWIYWLVAGYGLRGSRALAALAIMIAAIAVGLDRWGFPHDRSYGSSLLFAVESSVSFLRAPDVNLTDAGDVLQIVLRLLGPLLFGLALLSIRSRVKR